MQELITTLKQGYQLSEVISNLLFIRSHIKKFGVTKEFLHLVDDNKQLSHSLKIDLEEDNELIVVTEAFKLNIKDMIKRVKAWFANLWHKFLVFLGIRKENIAEKKESLSELYVKLKQNKLISLEQTINAISYEKQLLFFTKIKDILNVIANLDNLDPNDEKQIEEINETLKIIGLRFLLPIIIIFTMEKNMLFIINSLLKKISL